MGVGVAGVQGWEVLRCRSLGMGRSRWSRGCGVVRGYGGHGSVTYVSLLI